MFYHYNKITYTDWSQFDSNGYDVDGNHYISTQPDPCIYFVCDKDVYQVDIEVTMYSNSESQYNKGFYGEEMIFSELFWADENGEIKAENSIPFKIAARRDSYLLDVECPAGTLYRLDIGEGLDVEFDANAITFNTYEEYTFEEKIRSSLCLFIMTFIVISTGYLLCIKAKERN